MAGKLAHPMGRRDELLAAAEQAGARHSGADRQEAGEQTAEPLVREELRRRRRKDEDLPGLPQGDKSKVALARRLRQEMTMTLKWIARRLHIGSWTHVSNLLVARRKHESLTSEN